MTGDSRAAGGLSFTKMTGAGNDFIVLEADAGFDLALISRLCDRRYGIGADGLMVFHAFDASHPVPASVLGTGPVPAFGIDFYNSDGSAGMLCGNGARCAIEYARIRGSIPVGQAMAFSFSDRLYTGEAIAPGLTRIDLQPGYRVGAIELPDVVAGPIHCHLVDVGTPHAIVPVAAIQRAQTGTDGAQPGAADLAALDIETLGKQIRWHPRLAPGGANANFTAVEAGIVHIRTFERGVEGETLACGTGSTSAALVHWMLGHVQPPVSLITRSGEKLVVDFVPEGTGPEARVHSLSLKGPAKAVFTGTIDPASL